MEITDEVEAVRMFQLQLGYPGEGDAFFMQWERRETKKLKTFRLS